MLGRVELFVSVGERFYRRLVCMDGYSSNVTVDWTCDLSDQVMELASRMAWLMVILTLHASVRSHTCAASVR